MAAFLGQDIFWLYVAVFAFHPSKVRGQTQPMGASIAGTPEVFTKDMQATWTGLSALPGKGCAVPCCVRLSPMSSVPTNQCAQTNVLFDNMESLLQNPHRSLTS
eukprot:990382-Pelagomonas_calceolata.AAC.1